MAHQSLAPQDSALRTDDLKTDLKKRSIRGGTFTLTSQATIYLLRFVSTAFLARVLTPEDYGIVAMTVVLTGMVHMFSEAGLTWATVQVDEISHEQVSTLFWINVGLGCLLTLILFLLSPGVAFFYREPRLTAVTRGMACTFLIGGLGVQQRALLRRRMRFQTLAIIDVLSVMASVVAGIAMAYAGFGYWSLVGMVLIQVSAGVVLGWLAMPWRPSSPRWGSGTRQLIRFGGDILGFNVVNYFSRQADNLLIGWYWGAGLLGLYEKAYNLLLLPIGQINAPVSAVAVPTLSRINSDKEKFKRYFLGAFQVVASVVVPAILIIALFATQLVALWLGPRWMECAPLFRILSLAALLGALNNPMGWLLISAGLTRRYRQIGMVNASFVVTAFVLGLKYGPRGVAAGYSAVMCLITVPVWVWALRDTGIRFYDVAAVAAYPIIAGAVASPVTLAVVEFAAGRMNEIMVSVAGVVAFCVCYAFVLLIVFRKLDFFLSLLGEWVEVVPKNRTVV